MARVKSKARIAFDDEMWIGRTVDGATEWTQILGIESLPFPERTPEDVDVTHMQSPGGTRETIPGLMPVAEASVEKQYWPDDPGDMLLEELAALTEARTSEDVLIEFGIEGGARRTYRGRVNSYTPSSTVTEKRMATLAMSIFDRQPTNPRVVTP